MDSAPARSPFPTTRWTAVLAARDEARAREALGELCTTYWYPLYGFARRKGHGKHDAQDLTQSFLAYVLERDLFACADPHAGKLRSFLVFTFERFIAGERDRAQALKRGGGAEVLSLDAEDGEARFACEPVDMATPERFFERAWAVSVLDVALAGLAAEEALAGRETQFRELESFLVREGGAEGNCVAAAGRLGLSEEAVRQAAARLRKKFRVHLRNQIADTLRDATAENVEEELSSLKAALRG